MIASQMGYVLAAWGIVIGGIGGYAVVLIRRGRNLSERVPGGRQRWMR